MNTPAFLSRRDRQALRRQYRRGETPVRVVQAEQDGRVGLLAVTDRRVLWVSRGALRTRVEAVARDQVAHITKRTERYGAIVLKTKAGRRFEWWFLDRGARDATLEALQFQDPAPSRAGSGPVTFQATRPKATAAPTATAPTQGSSRTPASRPSTRDGSSYLPTDTAERRSRLRRQLEMGILTKREYEWQIDSLG